MTCHLSVCDLVRTSPHHFQTTSLECLSFFHESATEHLMLKLMCPDLSYVHVASGCLPTFEHIFTCRIIFYSVHHAKFWYHATETFVINRLSLKLLIPSQ